MEIKLQRVDSSLLQFIMCLELRVLPWGARTVRELISNTKLIELTRASGKTETINMDLSSISSLLKLSI